MQVVSLGSLRGMASQMGRTQTSSARGFQEARNRVGEGVKGEVQEKQGEVEETGYKQ